ncbi:hypothetical protein HGB25_02035 [Candidatus Saccharibacteria bacterium]|nr:hypothetical protein [Candidatus Saccharibacteria bacterium]
MIKFRNDAFQKSRGGSFKILDITCSNCGSHATYYKKDGSGMLRRMYLDRFIEIKPTGSELVCRNCKLQLGVRTLYKKENRIAYHLNNGAVHKKAVNTAEMEGLHVGN